MKIKKIIGLILIITIFINIYNQAYAVHFYDSMDTIFEAPVERLADLEIVSGVAPKTFNVDKNVTRAEFAKMITEATLTKEQREDYLIDDAELQKYSDLDKEEWYYNYVVIAVNRGLMVGFEDGTFRPNDSVTYEQIAKMVLKALGHTYIKENDPKGWQVKYIDKMYELQLFKNTNFSNEKNPANRGNCAIIIWNMLREETWYKVEENDVTGFNYISTKKTLFEQRFEDHVLIKNSTIYSFYEKNDYIYVSTSDGNYRLYDQSEKIKFTQVGGVSDLVLKRVLFPDLTEAYEVVGISTDIGYSLKAGVVKDLVNEGYDKDKIIGAKKDTDYAYLMIKKDVRDQEQIRSLSIDTSKFYIIDEIKYGSNTVKGYEAPDLEDYKDKFLEKSESNTIAHVYDKLIEPKEVTVDINKDDSFTGNIILYKNLERVPWSYVKKNDVVTKIDDNTFFLTQDYTKEGIFTFYDDENGNYSITIDDKEYYAYELTQIKKYNAEKSSNFFKLKDKGDFLGKKVRVYFDFTDRIVNIEEIEMPAVENIIDIANFGIFEKFQLGSSKGNNINRITININGESYTYNTSISMPSLNYGDLISFEFDEDYKKRIKSVSALKGNYKINDDFEIISTTKEDMILAFKGYKPEEYSIYKIDYIYEYGEYDNIVDYTTTTLTIDEISELKENDKMKFLLFKNSKNEYYYGYIIDSSKKNDLYYGAIQKIYKENKDSSDYTALMVIIGGRKNQTQLFKVSNKDEYTINEFFSFKIPSEGKFEIVEKYPLKVLGYYKDLTIESVTSDQKGNVSEVILEGDNTFDIANWKIITNEKEYDLNRYVIALLTLKKDKNNEYYVSNVSELKKNSLKLETNDKIAIDEVDGAVVVYRGYEENIKKK